MPKITIDGREGEVPAGVNLIEAAKLMGIEIPYYCYHPALSIVAQCRMCLVEVKGQHKLVPACQTRVPQDGGLEVQTKNERVKNAQKAVLEFFFVNHPVDCPICDQAGECKLQDYYMKYDAQAHRSFEPRNEKPKRQIFGPLVVYDAERCILCTRCVRYTQEITKTHELVMFQRGDHNEIGLFPGMTFDNAYSLNAVDICPVGALTNRDFRFKVRVWLLKSVPSVCAGCATGCNIVLQHHDGQVHRVLPRENPEINRYWLCDEGRLRYHPINEERFLTPRAEGSETTWEEAIERAAALLTEAQQKGTIGLVLSPQGTNEDNHVARLFARLFGISRIYVGGRPPGEADDFLRHADKNPNRMGVFAVEPQANPVETLIEDLKARKLSGLVVWGHDLEGREKDVAGLLDGVKVVGLVERESAWTDKAQVLLPIATWAEVDGHFTNSDGKVQPIRMAIFPRGESIPSWRVFSRLSSRLGHRISYRNVKEIQAEMQGETKTPSPSPAPAE